ncbi:ABC-F family ATP-binding cassette domain-containing protein [Pelagicoccus sp. SDUM812003]|uniref:ABC-F family ATP-binding cassette domain-containing protein n=1 Tax=Pelagicoccus sp. SDUM812003 TaxID=3041267 RepID=UPI00280E4C94|nr:ABC-F family ATP-binding cassette domain-containing protein [Pelagicoccus sp. SDUM812003]MDQ8204111.1 ABC-F family ATP-binding cassette domain-containing protein [Pelagicoccus sp. SDUM812003]
MITLQNLTLQYGDRFIYRDISGTIEAQDRIGLVGSNGAGKSTLLKVLCGKEEVNKGQVETANHVTFGYLPQDGIEFHGKSLFKETESAFDDVLSLKDKIAEAETRLDELDTSSDEFYEVLEQIGAWEHRLEELDVAKLPSQIESVLLGLGFSTADMKRQTEEFSGGWQMRIALAKLLLRNPSILLLDEPTNHLDVTSQHWLEAFLKAYPGALLIISHDRSFLDEICNRTFELSLGNLYIYSGNYSFYEKQSAQRKELQMKAFKSQQKEIAKAETFINKFKANAATAKLAQSRMKQLDKMERVEVERDEAYVAFSFAQPPHSSQTVIKLNNLSKSYGDKRIFRDASLRIEKGDRIAVVGVNGAGKTTMAKIIAGVEPFDAGEREPGGSTVISYFAQHQADQLDKTLTVLETMEEASEGKNGTSIRNVLGTFLFRGDDVFKKVNVLSGGERNRLALAKMLVRPANFLILDEPTNHLDIKSQEALSKALEKYTGTFMIVSHNRAFIDPIATKVLEVRHDGLTLFPGNVTDYLHHLDTVAARQ